VRRTRSPNWLPATQRAVQLILAVNGPEKPDALNGFLKVPQRSGLTRGARRFDAVLVAWTHQDRVGRTGNVVVDGPVAIILVCRCECGNGGTSFSAGFRRKEVVSFGGQPGGRTSDRRTGSSS